MKYNKDQWISSFEDAMVKLRPHMSARVLTTIGLMAWNKYGKNDIDPHKAPANGRSLWTSQREGSAAERASAEGARQS